MDAAGIDVQVMCATPILFQWDRDPLVGLDVSRYFNDVALEMCEGSGGRLRTLCQARGHVVSDRTESTPRRVARE